MRLAGKGLILEGAGGEKSPPLPYIEVADNEARALIALYPTSVIVVGEVAVEPDAVVDQSEISDIEAETAPLPVDAPVIEQAAPAAEAPVAPVDAATADASAPVDGAGDDSTIADHHGEHADDLVEAFELLEADDLVKTGDRAGKPKVAAVKDILGRDVTVDEIDAAWDARPAQ